MRMYVHLDGISFSFWTVRRHRTLLGSASEATLHSWATGLITQTSLRQVSKPIAPSSYLLFGHPFVWAWFYVYPTYSQMTYVISLIRFHSLYLLKIIHYVELSIIPVVVVWESTISCVIGYSEDTT
jgi:hypothetical protein